MTGPQGELGPRGAPGKQGPMGFQGEQGLPGIAGKTGVPVSISFRISTEPCRIRSFFNIQVRINCMNEV